MASKASASAAAATTTTETKQKIKLLSLSWKVRNGGGSTVRYGTVQEIKGQFCDCFIPLFYFVCHALLLLVFQACVVFAYLFLFVYVRPPPPPALPSPALLYLFVCFHYKIVLHLCILFDYVAFHLSFRSVRKVSVLGPA